MGREMVAMQRSAERRSQFATWMQKGVVVGGGDATATAKSGNPCVMDSLIGCRAQPDELNSATPVIHMVWKNPSQLQMRERCRRPRRPARRREAPWGVCGGALGRCKRASS